MFCKLTVEKDVVVSAEARFAYPLNNLPKGERMAIATACAQRLQANGLMDDDVVLDKIRVGTRTCAFASRPRNGSILIEIGPAENIPDMRLERRGSAFSIVRLNAQSIAHRLEDTRDSSAR